MDDLGKEPVYRHIEDKDIKIIDILTLKNYIVPGIIELTLIAKTSPYFQVFTKMHKIVTKWNYIIRTQESDLKL